MATLLSSVDEKVASGFSFQLGKVLAASLSSTTERTQTFQWVGLFAVELCNNPQFSRKQHDPVQDNFEELITKDKTESSDFDLCELDYVKEVLQDKKTDCAAPIAADGGENSMTRRTRRRS